MPEVLLLTGAGGFVGAAVHGEALRRGLTVRAPSRPEVDILRPETLAPAMEGVTTVIHAAGAAHAFQRTPATDAWLLRTNVDGTRNVVAAAREAGVAHVVLVSSVAVHGDPSDAYARSKTAGERAAEEEAAGALTLTTLRLATVYGEGDPGNVLRLVRAIDRHRFVWIGRGENHKSLIHRDDAAAAIVTAAAARAGGAFDVAAPPVTMREVVTTIARTLGRWVPRLPVGRETALFAARLFRAAALERTLAKWYADDAYDAAPFCRRFGFTPAVGFAEGIAREIAWYRRSASAGGRGLPAPRLDPHGQ